MGEFQGNPKGMSRADVQRYLQKKASLFGRELWVGKYLEVPDDQWSSSFVLGPAGGHRWRDCCGFHLNVLRWNLIVCIWRGDN